MKDPQTDNASASLGEATFVTRARRAAESGAGAVIQVFDGPDPAGEVPMTAIGLTVGSGSDCVPRLTDKRVSRRHVHIAPERDGFRVRDLGSTNGTFLDGAKIEDAWVPSGSVLTVGRTSLRLLPELSPVVSEASARTSLGEMVGDGETMRRLFTAIERAMASSASVLIGGETGTGKELVARALHTLGPRSAGPFVAIDCGAISANLIESELFGHVRGAFTGANDTRAGAFERAHGGVLFLDEVGELPLELQPKLLRALESREIRKLGGAAMQRVDVRIVAATHRDLAEMVDDRSFRSDLYYRLAVVQVELPALRQRKEDLPVLVTKLLEEAGVRGIGPIDGPNLELLRAHDWPGNVRELRNVLHRALASAGTLMTRFSDLPLHLGSRRASTVNRVASVDTSVEFSLAKEKMTDAFEDAYLKAMLAECQGNVALASRRSGIARRHLYDLLKKHGLRG